MVCEQSAPPDQRRLVVILDATANVNSTAEQSVIITGSFKPC